MGHVRGDTYVAMGHITGGPAVVGFVDFAFSDTLDINLAALGVTLPIRAFVICNAGDVKVTTISGKVDVYGNGEYAVGQFVPEGIVRIWATGTTSTKVRLYF